MHFWLAFLAFSSASALNWFSIKTLPPNPWTVTPTITPTPTPTPTTSASLCTVPLPTTTLTCPDRDSVCGKCSNNQICVQKGKEDDGQYTCPTFECQDCPEPVCNPACGCKEECVIEHNLNCNACPVAHCRPLPVCLDCPAVSCDAIKCEDNFECKLTPNSCNECGKAECTPKPCVECPTEPPTCMCPRGKQCKLIEGSCYQCAKTVCEDIPDPCKDCPGPCAVTENPNCHNCPPLHLCVEACRQCSPFLPPWKCVDPRKAIYVPRTCTSCAEYVCSDDCRECKEMPEEDCPCESEDDCIVQPRTCDTCPTWYCKAKECVKQEPVEACPCEDASLCVYRPGNCFTAPYYECVPPGKALVEPADLVVGRAQAKARNYR